MHIRILTCSAKLGYDLAAELESHGLGRAEVHSGTVTTFEMRHRPTLAGALVARVLQAIKPLRPITVRPDPALKDVDLELTLGDERGPADWDLRIYCDSPDLAGRLREEFDELGFRDLGTILGVQKKDLMKYSAATPLMRQIIHWRLKRFGLTIREEKPIDWADNDDDIWLTVRDPALVGKPLLERYDVIVRSDDEMIGEQMLDSIRRAGFRTWPLQRLSEMDAIRLPISIKPGPFGTEGASMELMRLTSTVTELVKDLNIDTSRYPVQVSSEFDGCSAEISLPAAICQRQQKVPYAGPYPQRFPIRVITDDPAGCEPLRTYLTNAGFVRVEITGPADENDLNRGYCIRWGAASRESEIANRLIEVVGHAMNEAGAGPPFELHVAEQFVIDDPDVWICFPLRGLSDGSLLERLTHPARFKLTFHCPTPAAWSDLIEEWKSWEFRELEVTTVETRDPQIDFGAAPAVLIDRLRDSIRGHSGLTVSTSKRWDDSDVDIWVYLPDRPNRPSSASWETDAFDARAWFGHGLEPVPDRFPSFIEATADQMRVGAVWLPRRRATATEPFVPDPADFAHFCLDSRTAETLHHVALSVALREPCLLEGETSTSKTSSILFLAALLGQPVVRINLNGQTDTGELVGRYVPNAEFGERSAAREGDDSTTVAHRMASWKWQDGPIVTAIKRGWWVLLDEVNLAEPQILERLNSVLEREPTLVLTEHDHSAFGSGGQPIHRDFRVFATMNPAEYSGRSVLSPAYRDRWRAHRFIPRPGESEYLAMLRYLVYGEQPPVMVLSRTYPGYHQPAPLAGLAEFPEIDGLLPALASFHAALEHAAGQSESDPARLGGRRKERYVFTRRGLLSVMEYLASPFGGGAALGRRGLREALLRYYLSRVSSAQDQRLIAQLLDAAGLAPSGEAPKPPAPPAEPTPKRTKRRRASRKSREDDIPF